MIIDIEQLNIEQARRRGEYWLYVNTPAKGEYVSLPLAERGYLEKPDDRPTLHVWAERRRSGWREYTVTYDDVWDDQTFRKTPYGEDWQWTSRVPPFIRLKLRTHRPSTVWTRRVRS
jgi:hypothetical protein